MSNAVASPFLLACRRQPTSVTPIWLMRQAGRYMPEYRAMRARHRFLELCKNPQAAAEVTLQPVERLGVDAAILFADILLVLEPLGVGLEFVEGEGPRIHRPLRSAADVAALPTVDVGGAAGVGGPHVPALRHRGGVPQRPDRRGRAGRAALRLLGGDALPVRLPGVR